MTSNLIATADDKIRIKIGDEVEKLIQQVAQQRINDPSLKIDMEIGAVQEFSITTLTVQSALTTLKLWFQSLSQDDINTPRLLRKVADILKASSAWHAKAADQIEGNLKAARAAVTDQAVRQLQSEKRGMMHTPGSLDVKSCAAGCCGKGGAS